MGRSGQLVIVAVGEKCSGNGFFDDLDNFCSLVSAQVEHIHQRLPDDSIKGEEQQQRQQTPEAAAHHAGAFFFVDLLNFRLGLLGVVFVFLLNGLGQGSKTAHFHHALFALGAGREQNQLDQQGEQDESQTVIGRELIEQIHQVAKGYPNQIGNAEC